MCFLLQAAQYIGEVARYLCRSRPSPYEKLHSVIKNISFTVPFLMPSKLPFFMTFKPPFYPAVSKKKKGPPGVRQRPDPPGRLGRLRRPARKVRRRGRVRVLRGDRGKLHNKYVLNINHPILTKNNFILFSQLPQQALRGRFRVPPSSLAASLLAGEGGQGDGGPGQGRAGEVRQVPAGGGRGAGIKQRHFTQFPRKK